MALEMFAGNTGDRLIARLPVEEGSYADVLVTTPWDVPATVRLRYEGGKINGYPALSPTLDSLEEVLDGASALIPAIRRDLAQASDEWERLAESAGEVMEATDDAYVYLIAFFAQWRAEDAVTYLRKLGPKPPLCPRVMPGQMLQLRLPVIYGKVAAVDLGVVQEIAITNA